MNVDTSVADKVSLHKKYKLYYLYDGEGSLWLNVHNLARLVGESRRAPAPLHHITRVIPKKDKLLNNCYENTNGATYIKEKHLDKVKSYITNKVFDKTLISSLESSVENIKEINNMNKHLNTLKFQNSNDQPSEVKWFVDDNDIVWYDSVDILFNLGFTKQGFTIKEEIGKIYQDRNEPKKLRAGRIHWNKESISVLKDIIDEKTVSDFWDNIEIIFNLVNCEIEKVQDRFNKLLDDKCHLSQELSPQELNHLYSNGWYKTKCQYHIPLYRKGNIVYNKGKTTVRECIEYLKMREGFDRKLKDLHNNLDTLTDGKDKVSIKHIGYKEFSYAEDYLKSKGFVNGCEWGILIKECKDIDLVKYAGFLNYKGDICFNFKAFKNFYKVAISGDDVFYHKFLRALKVEGFSRKTRLGTPVYMESGNHNTSKVFNAYSDFANSHNLTVTTKDEEDTLHDYSTLETTYIRKDEGEIVYEHEGVTYVRTSKLEDDKRTSVVKYLTHTLKFKPCKKGNITIDKKMQVNSSGCYEQNSSKVGCSKSEIDTFINHLEDQDSVGNEVEMSCKEEKPVIEFLPTPTKTIKYKELVSSKGWWVFKKEVWETKDVDVYEDEVDTFVSSLTNNCEIIEIK